MMHPQPPVRATAILGFGAYRPARVVTNDDLSLRVDTSDEWITSRVGIKERRFAGDDESAVAMAIEAGRDALRQSGVEARDIDLVIVASCTLPTQLPSAAPQVAHALGADSPGAYDLNAACAGFSYALAQASHTVQVGAANKVLVIGVEKFTDWVDADDRGTSIIFADGAGAAVVGESDRQRIGPVVWGSAGDRSEAIIVRDRASFVEMDGRAVYRWATTEVTRQLAPICAAAGIAPEQVDVFVPHQANTRIIDALQKAAGLRPDVTVARDIVTAGNTSAASIPLGIRALLDDGAAQSGDIVLTIGFGAGLTYAGQIFEMP